MPKSAERAANWKRRVPMRGNITRHNANSYVNRLLYLEAEQKTEPILIEISSPGGPIRESLEILRIMDKVKCPMATFCRGKVTGTALVIAAHGCRDFRVATQNARFVFDFQGIADAGSAEAGLLAEVVARDTRRTKAEILHWMEQGAAFEAKEALELGLIDAIAAHPSIPNRDCKVTRQGKAECAGCSGVQD